MQRFLVAFLTIVASGWAGTAEPVRAEPVPGPESSVVRIINYSQRGDWYTPWDLTGVAEATGSGFVIEGGLVMTNAHVVSDSRFLLVQLHDDAEPYEAEVHTIAHDCDLALLRLKDPSALDRAPRLEFGGVPELGSDVVTLGYPAGGFRLSSTRGVVSRIEPQLYLHSAADRHLAVQTDAAINPGNSGGPVMQDGRVVGVAFQAAPDLQSTGYFIPMDVIGRFLQDASDGRYDGYPELGVQYSGLENPAARARAGMADGETGVRVHAVLPGTSAEGVVRAGDVLLGVNGYSVANDGTIDPDGSGRLDFGMEVDRRQIGDAVTLRLLRDGERFDAEVTLRAYPWADRTSNLYDRRPRYYVYGGLVFVPLDLELVKTFGADWVADGDKPLLYEYLIRPLVEPRRLTEERIVLLRRLRHPVNANLAWHRNQVLERVNGKPIHSLEDLIDAIESNREGYHFIEFSSYRRFGVIDRREAERANAEILEGYGVTEDRRL